MASDWNSSADDRDGSDTATVLSFELDGTRFCVAADSVASVLGVEADALLASPTDPWYAGTVTVAGERIRVVDLARVFTPTARSESQAEGQKLLVFARTDGDGTHYGWLVDDVDVTRRVRTSAIEPARTAAIGQYVRGRIAVDGEQTLWLDERAMHD